MGSGLAATSSGTPYTADPHSVSIEEAISYYAGLPSKPRLLYRTGTKWSPPHGPEAYHRRKQFLTVFGGQIEPAWNQGVLSWDIVSIMEKHKILFNSLNVVRFKTFGNEEANEMDDISPVTIYIGVVPGSTIPTVAHNAANDIQHLLIKYKITEDINIEFAEFHVRHEVGPPLFKPVPNVHTLADVIGPFTPALGLCISNEARPDAQGTMALYLAEGGGSDKLLGLTCRHVLFGPTAPNANYTYDSSGEPPMKVHLLKQKAFTDLLDSIETKIRQHSTDLGIYEEQIEILKAMEGDTSDEQATYQDCIKPLKAKINKLESFCVEVKRDWSDQEDRVLGHIVSSPAVAMGVDDGHMFTEDWAVFQVDRTKLGDGFMGNKIRIGNKFTPGEFTDICEPCGDANWSFKYPADGLITLNGVITNDLMRKPDMKDRDDEPCLLVLKTGGATDLTIGRANGILSVTRKYDLENNSVVGTSRDWVIFNYSNKPEPFSKGGDSGSIVVDIRGRIGGMLTGGGGLTDSTDITFVTPFWWLLERIRRNGFPTAHLDVRLV